jgi:hypothetical protein
MKLRCGPARGFRFGNFSPMGTAASSPAEHTNSASSLQSGTLQTNLRIRFSFLLVAGATRAQRSVAAEIAPVLASALAAVPRATSLAHRIVFALASWTNRKLRRRQSDGALHKSLGKAIGLSPTRRVSLASFSYPWALWLGIVLVASGFAISFVATFSN